MILLASMGHAEAHLLGESYAFLRFADGALYLRTDFPLERLDDAVALDEARDGKIADTAVNAHIPAIVSYIKSHLVLKSADTRYLPQYTEHAIWTTNNGRYLSVHFHQANVGGQPATMDVRFDMFLDHDSEHRGVIKLLPPDATESDAENGRILAVFAPGRTRQTVRLDPGGPSAARESLPDPRSRGAMIAAVCLAACGVLAFAISARPVVR